MKSKYCDFIEKLEHELTQMFSRPLTHQVLSVADDITKAILNLKKLEETEKNHYKSYGKDHKEMGIISESTAKKWVSYMKNEDGTVGEHWTMEQTTAVGEQHGVMWSEVSKCVWYATLNMMYSDYCKVAKKYGVDSVDFYIDMAKAFLFDEDSVPPEEKITEYYYHIVDKD